MLNPTTSPTGPNTSAAVKAMILAADNPGNQEMFDEFLHEASLILPAPRTLSDEEAHQILKASDISHLFPPRSKTRSK